MMIVIIANVMHFILSIIQLSTFYMTSRYQQIIIGQIIYHAQRIQSIIQLSSF